MINSENGRQQEPTKVKKAPESSLDFNMQMIEPAWGDTTIPNSLKNKLNQIKGYWTNTQTGEQTEDREELWELLGFFTRDLRLGNIDGDELKRAEYYLNLANDLLKADFVEPFIIALSRVATIVELSQSKGGFLRKRNNTLTTEQYNTNLEPKRKSLFGMRNNN